MGNIEWIGSLLDGRFRVESRLGAGGMATVYLAFQETLERHVVVKVPDPALLQDEGFRVRFEREVRSLVRLRHPHIVTVLEAGDLDGVPYAVMEYLEGGNLQERLQENAAEGPLQKALGWLHPIAQALDFVHAEDVVHRDVKPANILFDARGNPFLSDFGVAKALGSMDTDITRAGATPGTATYMAPEAGSSGTLAGSADQYALGVILYRALSGAVPYEGDTPMAVMLKKLTEPPRPLFEVAPHLPPGVSGVVMRALAQKPEHRYPTCAALADAFRGAIAETPRADPTGTLEWSPDARDEEATRTLPGPERASARGRSGSWKRALPIAVLILVLLFAGYLLLERGGAPHPASPTEDALEAVSRRFLALPAWRVAEPEKNTAGLWRLEHVGTGLVFVLIPSGSFVMGSPAEEDVGYFDTDLRHPVTIREPFLICETECTQGAWERGGGTNGSWFDGAERPVDMLTWTECQSWCTRNGLRLPSESEWEYACRAGTRTRFSFGDREADLVGFGWYFVNSGKQILPTSTEWDSVKAGWLSDTGDGEWGCGAHAVAQKLPNPWGLYDMHGNAWEWCMDLSHGNYDSAPDDGSAWTSGTSGARIIRGGSWGYKAEDCRSAFRDNWDQASCRPDVGFRPAATSP